MLRPNSRFRDAAATYMGKISARREDSTAAAYTYWLEKLVLPQLGELRLAECDVARVPVLGGPPPEINPTPIGPTVRDQLTDYSPIRV